MAGQAHFQAAPCLLVRFAGRDLGVGGTSGTAWHSHLVYRVDMQGIAELSVATAAPMTDSICAGHLDEATPGVASKAAAVAREARPSPARSSRRIHTSRRTRGAIAASGSEQSNTNRAPPC